MAPVTMPQSLGRPTPSICVLAMSKPRAVNVVRLVSHSSTMMPVLRRSASLRLLVPKSRICSVVTMLMDCGVSLMSRSSPVAPLLTRSSRCWTIVTSFSVGSTGALAWAHAAPIKGGCTINVMSAMERTTGRRGWGFMDDNSLGFNKWESLSSRFVKNTVAQMPRLPRCTHQNFCFCSGWRSPTKR